MDEDVRGWRKVRERICGRHVNAHIHTVSSGECRQFRGPSGGRREAHELDVRLAFLVGGALLREPMAKARAAIHCLSNVIHV